MNKWQFTKEQVIELAKALIEANVEYMEAGYRADYALFSPLEYGPWRFCEEKDLSEIYEITKGKIKLSMMADIGRTKIESLIPSNESSIDAIRIACYARQIDEAIIMAERSIDYGYETFINIMAITIEDMGSIKACLEKINRLSDLKGLYLVDSFGSLTMKETSNLINIYKQACPDLIIGFHGHNNLQLALANSLIAAEMGATYLDGSCFGMGRGAGNCPLELLIPQTGKGNSNLGPILETIENWIKPLHSRLKWGYHLPYVVTGIANSHPSSAINYLKSEENMPIARFYDSLIKEEANITS